MIAALDREYWEEMRDETDPPSTLDLGGMSAGPAMVVGTVSYPVVGIVSSVSELPGFGLVQISTLAHVCDLPTPAS